MSEISTSSQHTRPPFEQMTPAAQALLFEIGALLYCTKKSIPQDGGMKAARTGNVRLTIEVIEAKYKAFFELIGSQVRS